MTREISNFINGQRVAAVAGETDELIDPSSGEVFATSPLSRAADIDAAFGSAAGAFEQWRETTPGERQRALLRIADAIEERASELVEVECQNTGKPRELTALLRADGGRWPASGRRHDPERDLRSRHHRADLQ